MNVGIDNDRKGPKEGRRKRPQCTLEPTLCSPDRDKSCFACCPPIRPAGYEHIQHVHIIKRMLLENTGNFKRIDSEIVPITGFSCWALGFLDPDYRLVGCLLHPARNAGEDLRYRVDYGKKCEREDCQEARVFGALGKEQRLFWLSLSSGLDSFSYSSKAFNPLFSLMGWGTELLGTIAGEEKGQAFDRITFLKEYPFFTTMYNSKAHAYLLTGLVKIHGTGLLKNRKFKDAFEKLVIRIVKDMRSDGAFNPGAPHVHRLAVDGGFLDFLRLSVGISKIENERALLLKKLTDAALEVFRPPR